MEDARCTSMTGHPPSRIVAATCETSIDRAIPRVDGAEARDRTGYSRGMSERVWTRLSVRLSVGVAGLFVILAIAVGVAIGALITSQRALEDVQRLTAAERDAAAIGVAAREQYIHEAHGVITRDPVHLGHDREWTSELAARVSKLRPMVGDEERALLDTVQSSSASLGETFRSLIWPAVERGDFVAVHAAQEQAEGFMDAMITASDRTAEALARDNTVRASEALRRARIAAVTAMVTTPIAALIAVLLAFHFVRRIVRPVRSLNVAAARIGEGDFAATAPPTGAAELEELREGLERMAARLRDREGKLLKSERLAGVGALAAGIAHELNNPLGVMLGYLKTLRRAVRDPEVADDLRIVEDEAHQCRRIVEDLLTFAREPALERRAVDLGALARDVVDRLEKSGELKGRSVDVHSDAIVADIDATRVAQVVRNLLLNAVAASTLDGRVRVEVTSRGANVLVRVVDEGTGIAPRDLPHLFEPFFSRRSGGTGLGLAVSHGIVAAHGGTLEAQSVEGEGTTMTVTLPREARA